MQSKNTFPSSKGLFYLNTVVINWYKATGCTGLFNTKDHVVQLHWLYSELEDHQVAPPLPHNLYSGANYLI